MIFCAVLRNLEENLGRGSCLLEECGFRELDFGSVSVESLLYLMLMVVVSLFGLTVCCVTAS